MSKVSKVFAEWLCVFAALREIKNESRKDAKTQRKVEGVEWWNWDTHWDGDTHKSLAEQYCGCPLSFLTTGHERLSSASSALSAGFFLLIDHTFIF